MRVIRGRVDLPANTKTRRSKYKMTYACLASETLTGVTQLKIGDVCLFIGSERSERDTYRGNTIENGNVYWRASEASETLSGVTQSRFRYIYLFIGERA